jgi:preprotein translocase subunit SecG
MNKINEMENGMVVAIADPMGIVQEKYVEDEQHQQQEEDDLRPVVIKIEFDESFLDALQLQGAGASNVQIEGTSSMVHRNRAQGSKRVRRLKRSFLQKTVFISIYLFFLLLIFCAFIMHKATDCCFVV